MEFHLEVTGDAVRLVHFNLCVALRGAGRDDDALRAALKWLEEAPREPSHNLIAGAILYDRFMYAEAVPYLEKGLAGGGGDAARGITSDPLRIDCQLADCYRRTGRPDDAAAIIERVLARDPAQWEARRLAGLLAYARHDFENAMGTFEALLAQRPAAVSAVTNLASTAIAAGDGARALAAIKTHLAAGGDEKTVRLLRARALSATGDHHGAVASAATILVLAPEPESDEVFLVLANSLSRAGHPDIARPFLERYQQGAAMRSELERAATAARMGSLSSSAYYRGRAYARAGRPGRISSIWSLTL